MELPDLNSPRIKIRAKLEGLCMSTSIASFLIMAFYMEFEDIPKTDPYEMASIVNTAMTGVEKTLENELQCRMNLYMETARFFRNSIVHYTSWILVLNLYKSFCDQVELLRDYIFNSKNNKYVIKLKNLGYIKGHIRSLLDEINKVNIEIKNIANKEPDNEIHTLLSFDHLKIPRIAKIESIINKKETNKDKKQPIPGSKYDDMKTCQDEIGNNLNMWEIYIGRKPPSKPITCIFGAWNGNSMYVIRDGKHAEIKKKYIISVLIIKKVDRDSINL